MARIELSGVTKKFKKTVALKNIDLVIEDKEFLVLFGPAGAGKTTMLKIIAGVEMPDEGLVKMDGEIVNLVEASERNIAMVFENYALYPHMTVYDNIAFPLRSKLYRESEDEIKARIHRVTKVMHIDMLLERLPAQLSNGQKQRVALGRSLVRNPNIFLMDEPLAHLDAKLRHAMRAELKEMQHVFNTTTLYVTHDYMEALSLGDRIAIIDNGELIQIGTGKEIYNLPVNEFVARLVGEPEINLLPVNFSYSRGQIEADILNSKIVLPEGIQKETLLKQRPAQADIGIRAQHIQYFFEPGEGRLKGSVYSFEPIGNKANLLVDVEGTQIRTTASNDLNVKLNADIWITFNMEKVLYFDSEKKHLLTCAFQEKAGTED